MNATNRTRIVGDVEFEAVRMKLPCPHWRAKVTKTGVIYEGGCFKGLASLATFWESVERTARIRGTSWLSDNGIPNESEVSA